MPAALFLDAILLFVEDANLGSEHRVSDVPVVTTAIWMAEAETAVKTGDNLKPNETKVKKFPLSDVRHLGGRTVVSFANELRTGGGKNLPGAAAWGVGPRIITDAPNRKPRKRRARKGGKGKDEDKLSPEGEWIQCNN
jgi:hypothetical protein